MKLKLMSVVSALALGLMAPAAQAETVLRVGSVAPTASPWGQWITQVAAHLNEISGGELQLNLLLDGQIGDELTMVRQAQRGRLDMVYVSNDPIAVLIPQMDLISSPYLFDSIDQGTCVIHDHLADLFGPLMRENGLVPLTWMEVGNSVVFSREPIHTPEDMRGIRLRVAQGDVKNAYFASLGTSPAALGTADTIPALQTGTIDAVTYPVVYGIAVGIPGMAPNITLTDHFRLVGSLAVSQRTWDGLSAQEQEWLMTVAPMGRALTQGILGAETVLLQRAADAGATVIELTDEERAQWRASGAGIGQAEAERMGPDAVSLWDALNAARAACGQ
ncbi:MAG: TRAP transporter substrate-binding protein [Rhodobacter sp.]|nr:TRAP transporter substrate-binding protein [Paracoccaceae bacterium]MCB1409969.1 TRAP transporter substrate-binding protein [Paracoccaceae bacterium]MCC0080323.1 TRAP transporter substrate-binding protein [Rhodobacter sp.]